MNFRAVGRFHISDDITSEQRLILGATGCTRYEGGDIYPVIVARVGVGGMCRCARQPGSNVIEMEKGRPLGYYENYAGHSNGDGEVHFYVCCICIGRRSVHVCGTCPRRLVRRLRVMN